MDASRKFMTRRPCQKTRVSERPTGAATLATVALLASFVCSPAMFSALAPQISQILNYAYKKLAYEKQIEILLYTQGQMIAYQITHFHVGSQKNYSLHQIGYKQLEETYSKKSSI